ncbi:MAG: tRNA(Ile)-lysidine synthase [Eubacteriales bacterium]
MNDQIQRIQKKIEGAIADWNMLPQGCSVVVGLSGGADSIALAHFLLNYAAKHHIPIMAAHINHGLRGAEADRDEQFVADWCRKNNMELKVLHVDVRALAAEKSEGIEECGRNVRYNFFRSLCGENSKIATAHTLSDSAETVLLNLAKGTGARGLCGIPAVRGNIVRPLISVTREEVEAYCAYNNLDYVTDSTNFSEDYTRNKIRLGVIPVLKSINPAFESAVFTMTSHLKEDEDCLCSIAEEKLKEAACPHGYRLSVLNSLPDAILNRAVSAAIKKESPARLAGGHIEAVAGIVRSGAGSVTVAGGIQCFAQGNTLFIAKSDQKADHPWCVPLNLPETVLPDGRRFTVRRLSRSEFENHRKINNLLFNNFINYDTINSTTSVRNRRCGDIFRPYGRGVTKSLKKLFNEAKIAPILRGNLAMLESGGKIIWIENFGASQDACVDENTQNIAEIKII